MARRARRHRVWWLDVATGTPPGVIAVVAVSLALGAAGCSSMSDDDGEANGSGEQVSFVACTSDHAVDVAAADLHCNASAITVTMLSDSYAEQWLTSGCQQSIELTAGIHGTPGMEACLPGTFDNSADVAAAEFACDRSDLTIMQVCGPTWPMEPPTCGAAEPYGDFRDSVSGCGHAGLYGFCSGSGCIPIEEGTLTVDDQVFVPSNCQSGESGYFTEDGFTGIDLLDGNGQRLRLVKNLDGTLGVLLFLAGSATAITMPAGCGQTSLISGDEDSTDDCGNTILIGHSFAGEVSANCMTTTHTVTGSATITSCL